MALILEPDQEYSSAATEAMLDSITMELYAEVPVYGGPNATQVFREVVTISREAMVKGSYTGTAETETRRKLFESFFRKLSSERAYSEYALGMPGEVIYRGGDKIVKINAKDFRTIYRQMST